VIDLNPAFGILPYPTVHKGTQLFNVCSLKIMKHEREQELDFILAKKSNTIWQKGIKFKKLNKNLLMY